MGFGGRHPREIIRSLSLFIIHDGKTFTSNHHHKEISNLILSKTTKEFSLVVVIKLNKTAFQ